MVVPYIGTWIETDTYKEIALLLPVVPYIGTWIETFDQWDEHKEQMVVPYIGTWIETPLSYKSQCFVPSYLI